MKRIALGLALGFTLIVHSNAAADPPRLTVDAWRQDLAVIARELPQRHPNLFYRMSRASWDSAVTSIERRLPSMSRNQAQVALMTLVALPRDGHTSIHPNFDPALELRYYPLELYAFDDGLFIRSAAQEYSGWVGAKVRRIGKVSADSALAAVGRTVSAENEWWLRAWAPERLMMPELLDGLGLVEDAERLPLVVERDGRTETLVVKPGGRIEPNGHDPRSAIDKSGWVPMRGAEPTPPWLRRPGMPYWVEYLDRDKVLYVAYRGVISLDHVESNVAFWRRVFALADSLPIDRFVLDIRENIGGNSFFNRQVIRGLIRRPALDRKDRLFVVIGRRTFSAAMSLAQDLEKWTNATFVGEPTGNATYFFGDHDRITLPNSHFTVNVSTLPWRPYDPRDRREFIAPSVYTPLTAASYRESRDPAFEVVMSGGGPDLRGALEAAAARGDTVAAERLVEQAKSAIGNRFRSVESEVNEVGYTLLNSKRAEPALAVFRINTRAYPASANTWDSLGEALAIANRKEAAIAAYRRALAINPGSESAQRALAALGAGPSSGRH